MINFTFSKFTSYYNIFMPQSQEPLYFPKKIQKIVNPLKIASSIQKEVSVKNRDQQSNGEPESKAYFLPNLHKHKKITKQQINKNKHYRTKMCPHGRQCRRRIVCTFAHTEQELRKPFIHRKNPCKLYQRGQCSLGSVCKDYHGNIDLKKNYKYKEQICRQFLEGKCKNGELCIRIHQEPQPFPQLQHHQSQIPVQLNPQQYNSISEPKNEQRPEPAISEKAEKQLKNDLEINPNKNKVKQIEQIPIDGEQKFQQGGFSIQF